MAFFSCFLVQMFIVRDLLTLKAHDKSEKEKFSKIKRMNYVINFISKRLTIDRIGFDEA